MEDALFDELAKKQGVIKGLAAVVQAQNASIRNREIDKIAAYDNEKKIMLEKLAEIDNSLKPFMFKKTQYPQSVREIVNSINTALENLVDTERENEKLLSEMELSASGRHIEAYKKAVK